MEAFDPVLISENRPVAAAQSPAAYKGGAPAMQGGRHFGPRIGHICRPNCRSGCRMRLGLCIEARFPLAGSGSGPSVFRAPIKVPPLAMSPQQPERDAIRRLRRMLVRLAPLGCLLGLLVLAYAMGWHRNLRLEALVENNAAIDAFIAAHQVAAILSFVVIYALGVALVMPAAGAVLAVIGGFLFSPANCGG